MRAKPPVAPRVDEQFRPELVNIINTRHELVRLAALVDWSVFDREFGARFGSTTGRPALPITRGCVGVCRHRTCAPQSRTSPRNREHVQYPLP
jgi:hypothetical protein